MRRAFFKRTAATLLYIYIYIAREKRHEGFAVAEALNQPQGVMRRLIARARCRRRYGPNITKRNECFKRLGRLTSQSHATTSFTTDSSLSFSSLFDCRASLLSTALCYAMLFFSMKKIFLFSRAVYSHL